MLILVNAIYRTTKHKNKITYINPDFWKYNVQIKIHVKKQEKNMQISKHLIFKIVSLDQAEKQKQKKNSRRMENQRQTSKKKSF